MRTVCIYLSKDVGSVVIFWSQKGLHAKKFGKRCFEAKDFFSHNCKHKIYIYRNCKIYWHRTLYSPKIGSDSHLQEHHLGSTEWFVLIADCNETKFEKIP
jgi:hypothetical protein